MTQPRPLSPLSPRFSFCDLYDRALAEHGLPAIFVLNAKQELRLAPTRTREAWQRLPKDADGLVRAPAREVGHYLLTDRATGWVQYVLATSPALVQGHPRARVERFADQDSAVKALGERALSR